MDDSNTLATPLPAMLSGKTILKKMGNSITIPTHQLGARPIALLFCMSECPDCQAFQPKLEAATENLPVGSADIIVVSSEKDAKTQFEHVSNNFKRDDWSTIPLDDELTIELKRNFGAFAGSEAEAVGVKRRAGIPALYTSHDGGKTWSGTPLNENASVEDITKALAP
ncbi:hypothetical protein ScalyP_jg3282 [Parmales sp. scaly parma]|nr:hypothetical protein ScalyP_jg3282 [Parmales sp. scaly parma]